MSGILFDTSVYISALREGDGSILSLRRASRTEEQISRPLWLSVVVLEELYAGAANAKVREELKRMEREFANVGRLLIPGWREWTSAGIVLSQIGRKHGFDLIGRARMTNDVLIAMSVGNHGFTIQTRNSRDFKLIAQFRPFNWETLS